MVTSPDGTRESRSTDSVDAEFWAIVCADEDLLRAEFHAIVEPAEVSGPTPAPHGPVSAAPRGPGLTQGGGGERVSTSSGTPAPAPAHQRSPPTADGARP